MKRLVLVVAAVACTGPLAARSKSAADFFIEFNTMEEKHKRDWFEYVMRLHDKKMKMIENQHHDWVAMKNNHLKQAQ